MAVWMHIEMTNKVYAAMRRMAKKDGVDPDNHEEMTNWVLKRCGVKS